MLPQAESCLVSKELQDQDSVDGLQQMGAERCKWMQGRLAKAKVEVCLPGSEALSAAYRLQGPVRAGESVLPCMGAD